MIKTRLVAFLAAVLIFLSVGCSANSAAPTNSSLRVHYLDVGQGDAILIQIPNGKTMLIDSGTGQAASSVIGYLKSLGLKKLDIVLATHPHEDHIGAMDQVINSFDVGQVIMPKKDTNTAAYRDLLNAIARKGLKITAAKAGLKLNLGESVDAQLVAPNSSNYEDINNYSAVLRLQYANTSFLFTGDAEAESEQQMLSSGYKLTADVLKVGHHGSHSSTTQGFLAKVNPRYAVISCGKNNDYGHPHKETLNKLASDGVKVYRTDLNGTIIASSDGSKITFSTK